MAYEITGLVYSREIEDPITKAVLLYAAFRINHKTGEGIWASKRRWADEIGCSVRTVQNHVKRLVEAGLLIEAGEKGTSSGPVKVYHLNIEAIKALPPAYSRGEGEVSSGQERPVQHEDGSKDPLQEVHPSPAQDAPHPRTWCTPGVQEMHPNRPSTVPEPSSNHDGSDEPDDREEEGAEKTEEQPNLTPQQDPEVDHAEEFWNAYPETKQKVGRAKVKALFDRIVAGKVKGLGKVDPERIVRAAKAYAAEKPDPDFICAPTRWLNEERWENFADKPEVDPNWSQYHPGTKIWIWENLA